ncbi:MAG: hypothetical protein PVG78_16655 [Desulfobacterales bacterium]|jgi:hypothetical protein
MIKVLIVVVLLAAFYLGAVVRGGTKWSRQMSLLVGEVVSGAEASRRTVDLKETEDLPAPVKRYFRRVLQDGLPIVSQAYLVQKGGFRTKPEAANWAALSARQAFSAQPRAFVWDAKVTMAPGLSVRVCDAYRNGSGQMKAALLSIVPLVDAKGQRQIDEGALMRYLAEAVWFPTALLPGRGVVWEAIDDRRAEATVTDAGHTVSLEFSFNDEGEIVSVYSAGRFREVNGEFVPTPWEGRFSDYTDVNGYRVPTEAEVAWHLPDGVFAYWKATITEIRYR